MVNAYVYFGAADEFPRWIHAGGRALDGLKRRRASERGLFLEAVLSSTWLDEVAAIPRKD
jgi:lysozyme